MLNKKGSEVSMGNASNYLLSPGALVCALDTENTIGPTNPGKGWLSIYLKYPYFRQYGWISKGEDFVSLKAVINYLETESMLSEGPWGRNKEKYERRGSAKSEKLSLSQVICRTMPKEMDLDLREIG